MRINYRFYLVSAIISCLCSTSSAYDKEENQSGFILGFNYGIGTQQCFPFNYDDYSYDVQFFKLQINKRIVGEKKWTLEANVEPAIYLAEHQLLNLDYVQPRFGEDYLDQRIRFSKKKTIQEYVLNLGLLFRYNIFKHTSTYLLGSVGPMISDTATERLAKGFAFSDIIAVGISYRINVLMFDFRFSLRHVSNANIQSPNTGHNSMNIEMGLSFQL